MTKADLRREMRARLQAHDPGRGAKSRAIFAALAAHPALLAAETVALFAPLPTEPEIAGLCATAGPRFCFPRVAGAGLEFIVVSDPAALAPSAWNPRLREPSAESGEIVPPAAISLLLVPGLAFTREGRRLGHGGGYYDRLLAQRSPTGTVLGVCFAFQLLAEIPCEPHDLSVDAVVTESGTFPR